MNDNWKISNNFSSATLVELIIPSRSELKCVVLIPEIMAHLHYYINQYLRFRDSTW